MNILLISNEYNKPNRIGNPIISRIRRSLSKNANVHNVVFVPFKNSIKSLVEIRKAAHHSDIIHIQFGGLYAFIIWFCLIGIKKPKLLTFHGTDIHAKEMNTTKSKIIKLKIWASQKASFCSIILFDRLGFVSDTLIPYIPQWICKKYEYKFFRQPLGVDYSEFIIEGQEKACKKLNIPLSKYVLFSDKTGTILKRRDIAAEIIKELGDGYELLIMCGVKPELVPTYINSCSFVLLTSDEEGSPNITREALALNKRVFSVDVGDVKQQISGLNNSAIISREPKQAAKIIREKLLEPYKDNTRETLKNKINFDIITEMLVSEYCSLLN